MRLERFKLAPDAPGRAGCFPGLPRVKIGSSWGMPLPEQPLTLTVGQIAELNQKLSTMRHDINNSLALVLAGVELMRVKPETTPRMMGTIAEQPARINGIVRKFSDEFEVALGIKPLEKVH